MNLLQSFLKQFHFTKAERHGAAALALLAGAVFVAPVVYRRLYRQAPPDYSGISDQISAAEQNTAGNAADLPAKEAAQLFVFDPNTAPAEQLVHLGLPEKVAQTIVKYRNRGGRFRTPEDLQKIYVLAEEDYDRLRPFVRIKLAAASAREKRQPERREQGLAELFSFDPNTASEQELLRLGLSRPLVSRLLRYREKGGSFFDKPDFRKLYGLSDAEFARLEPFIEIRRETSAPRPATYSGGMGAGKPSKDIDINTASPEDWQQLPGIGAVRAQKIVRYRDKLGGFARIGQVAETYGLPDSIYQMIRAGLRLETPVFRMINLNTATAGEIYAHPYFSPQQARLIIAYREQHGRFGSAAEIGRIQAFTDKDWLERVLPYLTVQ